MLTAMSGKSPARQSSVARFAAAPRHSGDAGRLARCASSNRGAENAASSRTSAAAGIEDSYANGRGHAFGTMSLHHAAEQSASPPFFARPQISTSEPLLARQAADTNSGNAQPSATQDSNAQTAQSGGQTGGQDTGQTGSQCGGTFLNSGTSLLNRQLGPIETMIYMQNGVEIQFQLDPGVLTKFRNIRPRQWAGPDGIWIKQGNPLSAPWQPSPDLRSGSGPDDPLPESQEIRGAQVIYDDAPGPDLTKHSENSMLHVVQNFTGWVEGVPVAGGAAQQLCEPLAWFARVTGANFNWSTPGAVPSWQRPGPNDSGRGWSPVGKPDFL